VNLKSDILFDTDSAIVKPSAVDQLQQVGDILAKYSDDRIRVEGFTDSTGSSPHNEELSTRRASSVKNVLLSRGVKERQMLVQGQGENRPVAANTTPTGRAKNRRVELYIDVPEAS
jgi:outer membrane protein OmpA-like peptidoglycan-associated protein